MSRHIEGRHDGRKIVLPVLIMQPEPSTMLLGVEANALLDTGATTSGITPRVVQRLSLRPIGKRPIGHAGGEAQAERYLFRVGLREPTSEPAFPFVFEELIGFALSDSFSLDALIGMDVLSQCDLTIHRSRRWRLSFG